MVERKVSYIIALQCHHGNMMILSGMCQRGDKGVKQNPTRVRIHLYLYDNRHSHTQILVFVGGWLGNRWLVVRVQTGDVSVGCRRDVQSDNRTLHGAALMCFPFPVYFPPLHCNRTQGQWSCEAQVTANSHQIDSLIWWCILWYIYSLAIVVLLLGSMNILSVPTAIYWCTSYDKCTCKSLWIKESVKCLKCKYIYFCFYWDRKQMLCVCLAIMCTGHTF